MKTFFTIFTLALLSMSILACGTKDYSSKSSSDSAETIMTTQTNE